MIISSYYRTQVELVLDILPTISVRKCFALKGGTALNLFIWDTPRLSVDIDLVYLPINSREQSLEEINNNLEIIKSELEQKKQMKVILTNNFKLICHRNDTNVKVEVNTTIRGALFEPSTLELKQKAQNIFARSVKMPVLNKNEIYGGKICAALDRQHPRDIFDISKIIIEGKGSLSKSIKDAFIFYLLSHNRPINEILNSNVKDNKDLFEDQFDGMTTEPFCYDDFLDVSKKLRVLVSELFDNKDKDFILSFKKGYPDWSLFIKDLSDYPSIKWKLKNINKLYKINPKKAKNMFKKLENVLMS